MHSPPVERLEDRRLLTVTSLAPTFHLFEGPNTAAEAAVFNDTDNVTAANFTNVTINWGDGTAPSAGTVAQGGGAGTPFVIRGDHTYAEEGSYPVTASFHDQANGIDIALRAATANVADASLSAGSPMTAATAGTPMGFSGVGGSNGSGGALTALQSFEAAIGGTDNGSVASPQSGGFRTVNWDGVALDGSDFGGDTTAIDPGKTVAVPLNRFQERGIFFNEQYAVSGDGFADVNPAAAGLFPAFSPGNTFAPFNDNTINLSFVVPGDHNLTQVGGAARGFGAVFLNVQTPNTTSIEFFHGSQSLGKFFVPVGTQGQPEFLGELFGAPVVTGVTLTLGTDVLFKFDGSTFSAGGANAPTAHNLVATDDFAYPEPVANPDDPAITGTQGQPFSGTVARFSDTDPGANANDFSGLIRWGDRHATPATFTQNAQGGFDVSGTNTFARGGTLGVQVQVQDRGGSQLTLNNVAQVTPLPTFPVVAPKGVPVRATANTSFGGTVARFTSVPGAAAADFTATIDWGDGNSTGGTVVQSGKTFAVTGTHTYASGGSFTVNVQIQNTGGTSGAAQTTAKVRQPKAKARAGLDRLLRRMEALLGGSPAA